MYNYTKEIAKWFTWTPNISALWCIEVPLCVFQMYHLHCSCDKTSCGKRNICLIKSHQDIHHCTVSIWKKLHLIWPTDVTAKVSGWESSNSKWMLRWFSRRVQCGRCSDFHFQNQFRQQHSGEIMNLWTIIPQMTRRVQSWRGNGASFSFCEKPQNKSYNYSHTITA